MKIAVIPARGGSKRIPHKNIKFFHGLPIIAYSIRTAKATGIFDRIIVSTDNEDIKKIALSFGAEVPFVRPKELSDDHALPSQAVAHTIKWLHSNGMFPSAVCCIYATAPLMQSGDILNAYSVFQHGKWDYVFPACKFTYPIFRSFSIGKDGSLEMFFPEHYKTRSQDLETAWHDAGQFYWGKPDAWLVGKPSFSEQSTIIELPNFRVCDIDTIDDWIMAETMAAIIFDKNSS